MEDNQPQACPAACQDCGRDDETVCDCLCPYALEIYDEEIPMRLCKDCYHERCMDI